MIVDIPVGDEGSVSLETETTNGTTLFTCSGKDYSVVSRASRDHVVCLQISSAGREPLYPWEAKVYVTVNNGGR